MTELPDGWITAEISEVSVKAKQKKPKDNESFSYIDIGSIDRVSKKIVSSKKLIGIDAPSRARKEVLTGDTIVSLTRPNLNALAFIDSEYNGQVASTGFEVIRPLLVEPRYIFNICRSNDFIDSISIKGQGALYPAAKSSDVQSYSFGLPPIEEQKRIANKLDELLGQVGTIKARVDAIPDILKHYRQSVLAAAVSGRLTKNWRLDNNVDRVTKVNVVGDVAKIATGKTPKRTNPNFWEGGTVPWLTSSATGNEFSVKADQFVTTKAVAECGLKIFKEGTLLMAMYGEGKTRGQVTELKLDAACNQACAAITANEELVVKDYLKLCLRANYIETRKAAAGGAQPNLNLSKVRAITLMLPGLNEQIEIVKRVMSLLDLADQIEERVKGAQSRVDKLTQSILAKAFRGELVPQDPNDEPASELLERIQKEREAAAKLAKAAKKTVNKGNS